MEINQFKDLCSEVYSIFRDQNPQESLGQGMGVLLLDHDTIGVTELKFTNLRFAPLPTHSPKYVIYK